MFCAQPITHPLPTFSSSGATHKDGCVLLRLPVESQWRQVHGGAPLALGVSYLQRGVDHEDHGACWDELSREDAKSNGETLLGVCLFDGECSCRHILLDGLLHSRGHGKRNETIQYFSSLIVNQFLVHGNVFPQNKIFTTFPKVNYFNKLINCFSSFAVDHLRHFYFSGHNGRQQQKAQAAARQ